MRTYPQFAIFVEMSRKIFFPMDALKKNKMLGKLKIFHLLNHSLNNMIFINYIKNCIPKFNFFLFH